MFAVEKELVLSACSTTCPPKPWQRRKLSERNRVNRKPSLAAVLATALLFLAFNASTTSASLSVPLYPTHKAITSSDTAARYGIIGSDNPLAFLDVLGLSSSEGPSWGQGGTAQSSSYDTPVLRAGVNASYLSSVQTFAPSLDARSPAAQRRAEVAAAPVALVVSPFVISAASVVASEASLHAAALYAASSPVSVPTTIRLMNAALGPDEPTSELDEFIAGEAAKVGIEQWKNYKDDNP